MEMFYSNERGTWNVFDGAEWYFEGTYEECAEIVNAAWGYEDDDPADYDDYEERW